MADRIIKLETAHRKTNLRPVYFICMVVGLLTIIRFALPAPPERMRESGTTDAELISFVKSVSLRPTAPQASEAVVDFGSMMFHDNDFTPYQPGRQGRNESCSGCHQQASTSSTFLTSDRRAPDLRQTRFYQTFGVDGRSDTLEDFISSHIEFRSELASNRIRIVRLVLEKYRDSYQKAYGAPQVSNAANLPDNGLPAMDRLAYPVLVSSFILETIADSAQLTSILDQAQQEHLAPAVIVSRTILSPFLPDNTDTGNYQRLPVDSQNQINAVFANVVKALSAYVIAMPAPQTAFDRYAEKLAAGTATDESLAPEFNTDELAGLRLFHGAAGCTRCHNGPGFTDNQFHNIGLPAAAFPDAGRATGMVLNVKKDLCVPPTPSPVDIRCLPNGPTPDMIKQTIGGFRTPALRGFSPAGALTRNGQIDGSDDMLEFYSQLNEHPAIGVRDPELMALNLTKEETAALSAFLNALGTTIPREQLVISKK